MLIALWSVEVAAQELIKLREFGGSARLQVDRIGYEDVNDWLALIKDDSFTPRYWNDTLEAFGEGMNFFSWHLSPYTQLHLKGSNLIEKTHTLLT